MERRHFSCGTIDGQIGMRSKRALKNFQINQGIPPTSELDDETRLRLGKPHLPFVPYVVTEEDMRMIHPTPRRWAEKREKKYLGYNNAWEMAAERFHTTPVFLKRHNPEVSRIRAGTVLTVPNLGHSEPLPKAGRIEIILNETTLLVYDPEGKLVACFPCSIASKEEDIPERRLTVAFPVANPNYTFNPKVLPDVAEAEGLDEKFVIPPGPNNPVGLAWIALSQPGYGIHGTPDPMAISVTGSHGCFRLANWNAIKLFQMVEKGTPVWIKDNLN